MLNAVLPILRIQNQQRYGIPFDFDLDHTINELKSRFDLYVQDQTIYMEGYTDSDYAIRDQVTINLTLRGTPKHEFTKETIIASFDELNDAVFDKPAGYENWTPDKKEDWHRNRKTSIHNNTKESNAMSPDV